MIIEIKTKKENIFLKRLEVDGKLKYEGATPSNKQVAESLAKELKTEVNLIVVKHIHTAFGSHQASFSVAAYADEISLKKAERTTSHIRKKMEEEKKKSDEAAKEEKDKTKGGA